MANQMWMKSHVENETGLLIMIQIILSIDKFMQTNGFQAFKQKVALESVQWRQGFGTRAK